MQASHNLHLSTRVWLEQRGMGFKQNAAAIDCSQSILDDDNGMMVNPCSIAE